VLLGASILFDRMLALGMLGVGVAWIVTPIVIIVMYIFSQKFLKMHDQRELAMTISSATAVCGVSAAIASGTAAKAKKEEITLAISITL
ncbi:putative sulfate exporter family transporter, partial [Pseudomonas sp. 2822-17]|uniref:putative sulfate exporter family transporter n=1 Tax=Pseudomonas sp. 2822-17 TaxID=1712678 RepID=UPI00117B9F40